MKGETSGIILNSSSRYNATKRKEAAYARCKLRQAAWLARRETCKTRGLAKAIGQSRSTLYRRMEKGGGDFTAEEIFKMKDYIPLTDQEVIDIFLTQKVATMPLENNLAQ